MNKRGQITIEFIIVLGFILLFVFFVLTSIHKELSQDRALLSIKSRTVDLINKADSKATLIKVDFAIIEKRLTSTLHIKRNGSNINLDVSDYTDIINSIKNTTNYETIEINFSYFE